VKEPARIKRMILFIGGFGLSLLMTYPSIALNQNSLSSTPPDSNQDRLPGPAGLTGMKADRRIILQDRFGRLSSSERKLYRAGMQVRMEPLKPGLHEDIYIYDYAKLKQYRVIPSDKVYFESNLGRSEVAEAQRDGLIPVEKYSDILVEKENLAETTFDEHPCRLMLQVRSLLAPKGSKEAKKRLAVDYTLLWEATDLNNQPVRIVYTSPDFITKIIEYRNARIEQMDASLFQPPKDYPRLSPF
jgi:hypothetical protein